MARVPVGKVLLRNLMRHTGAHNKVGPGPEPRRSYRGSGGGKAPPGFCEQRGCKAAGWVPYRSRSVLWVAAKKFRLLGACPARCRSSVVLSKPRPELLLARPSGEFHVFVEGSLPR